VQAFDKRLDYFYVTRKYDGPLAVQWLFINIYWIEWKIRLQKHISCFDGLNRSLRKS